jgi:hypothetical protein
MSKYLVNSLKLSGGILCIYCASLAIAPIAQAGTNISNAGGTTSYANGFVSAVGDSGAGGAGAKSNEGAAVNALAANRAAQGFKAQLETAQASYNNTTTLVNQLSSSSPSSTSINSPKPAPVRFAIKSGGVLGESLTNCGCPDTDLVSVPSPINNSAELVAAKAAQAKAAMELAQSQAQVRQFLAANQSTSTGGSPVNNSSIPLW